MKKLLWMGGVITLVVLVFWVLVRYPSEEEIQGNIPTESEIEISLPTANPNILPDALPEEVRATEAPYIVDQNYVLGSTTIVGNRAVFILDSEDLEATKGEEMITSPDVTGKIKVVADWEYYDDKTLKEIEVPNDTGIIGIFAFARSGLESVVLPEGLTTIEYAAFYHCDSLKKVNIPASVTRIEAEAFSYTTWMNDFLTGKTGNSDFLVVGDGVLLAYRGRSEQVNIPEGVKYIAAKCFLNHTEIKDVVFPDTLKYVEKSAFDGCVYQPAFE